MISETTDIPVTIVSTDPEVLRELSWTLSTFGYRVETSSDWSEDAPWRWAYRLGILLLDPSTQEELGAPLENGRGGHFLYRVLIEDANPAGEDRPASAAADDVISRPVNPGELLARLRTGARRLEFERRLRQRAVIDQETGLLSRVGFVGRAETLRREGRLDRPATLAMFEIDFFEQIRVEYGRHATKTLLAGLSRSIERAAGGKAVIFMSSPDVIGVLLVDSTEADGRLFAQTVVSQFGDSDTLAREVRCCPSVSAAVSPWSEQPAEEIIQLCEESLWHARSCGGGTVVMAEEAEQKSLAWRRDVEAGAFFQKVVAQDVMEVLPVLISSDDPAKSGQINELRRSCQQGKPVPSCLPVVDDRGMITGIVNQDALASGKTRQSELISQVVPMVSPEATLVEVLDAFSECGDGRLAVVKDNRPLGYITCDTLTELFTEPVSRLKYYCESPTTPSLKDLAVPLEIEPVGASTT